MAGEATLKITLNQGIQSSNYGKNSFWIENVGDKLITKIELDVTGALFPDTVFDPFGEAGDSVARALTINTNGKTGVIAPDESSYIGAGGTAGYEKIQILFSTTVNGGFQPGEKVGFSIDMDPNSIAGSSKETLDAGSDPSWDVGGVNGAELIGSTFTVTFADGTTATGQLQGVTDSDTTNDQGGAQALASQAVAGGTVDLQVNGLATGEAGTYAAGGPQVIVNGPAGETARIVLAKGFIQPGENLFSEPYKSQLDAQLAALAASDFPANNAVQFQVRDVVLTGSPQDITSLFNFNSVPIAGVENADALPLGFVASLIDPAREGFATGPVTTPIYLIAEDGTGNTAPVAANDTASSDGAAVTVDVLANDSDADGDPLSLSGFGQGANGTVTRDTNGTPGDQTDDRLIYTPNAGFTGNDSFTYTINDGQGGSDTGTVAVTVSGSSTPVFELHINAGGGAYTSTDGVHYIADAYFTGGNTYSTSSSIAFTDDPILYQTERYGTFGYAIPVANGTYSVTLDFAEIYLDQAGGRIFDVSIEGALRIDDLDVWAAAGDNNTAYTAPSILVEVTDGTLNVNFGAEVQSPKVSAISIKSVTIDGAPPVATDDSASSNGGAVTVDVLANDSDPDGDPLSLVSFTQGANGTVTRDTRGTSGDLSDDRLIYTPNAGFTGNDSFTYTIDDGQGGSDTGTVAVTVSGGGSTPAFELHINAGGGAYTSVDGVNYVADAYFVGGSAVSGGDPVAGTEDDPLYQTWRSGTFGYQIAVANGTYAIELQFAESFQSAAGQRLFDVKVEGATVLDDFDIFAAAGGEDIAYTTPSIVVEVTDGTLDIGFAKVLKNPIVQAINVRSIGDVEGSPPVAVDDAYTVAEDGTLTVGAASGVLANDSDPDGDPLTASVVSNPTNGTLTLNADGSFTYVPNADFSGTDNFTYAVDDGSGIVATGTATIEVAPVNDAPVAVDDAALSGGPAVTVDVLANDSDPDGDPLALVSFGQGAGGSVTRDDHGTPGDQTDDLLVYTPNPGFFGQDSFTYTIEDGQGGSSTATVEVTVSDGSTPTFELHINAGGGAYTSVGGISYIADAYFSGGKKVSGGDPIAGTDDDPLYNAWRSGTFSYAIPVANGTYALELQFAETYQTAAGERLFDVTVEGAMALDDFDIFAAAGAGDTAYTTAPITVEVTDGVLDIQFLKVLRNPIVQGISLRSITDVEGAPPVAANDAYTMAEDGTLTVGAGVGVLANDSDPDGDALAAGIVTGPTNGSLTLNADGSFTYIPAQNFNGTDSFTYAVQDSSGLSATATATIEVTPVNDAPVAVADGYVTPVDTALDIGASDGVLANDADVEGDTLSVVAVNGAAASVGSQITLPSGAQLTLNANGSFDYVPPAGFAGEDSFTYTVSDGVSTGNTATVTIDVVSSEPPVVETNTGATTNEAGATVISAAMLETTDPDTSPDLIVYTLTSVPANGVLKLGNAVLAVGDSFTQTDINGGLLSYQHDGSETLADGFGYNVSDGLFTVSGQEFGITVNPVNDLPVATDDSYTADHDTPLTVPASGVLTNDTDPDGPALAVSAVNGASGNVGSQITLPSGAQLTLNADGSFVYTPAAGFSGEDSFTYTVDDGAGGTDTALVAIDVASAEPAFAVHINAGGSAYTTAGGVQYIADAYFVNGQKFTTTSPIAGTVDDPLFQTERYANSGSLSYAIPVAPGSYAVSLDFAELFFDAANQRVFDVVIEGKLVLDNLDVWQAAGDQFTAYEPPSIVVDVLDGTLNIDFVKGKQNPKINAISVVDVTSNDNTPIAQGDSASASLGTSVVIDVLANDVDFDGDPLQIVSVGNEATLGTVTINDAGTPGDTTDDYLVYTSNGSAAGPDTFTYTISDSTGKTATATVEVDVLPLDAIAFDKVSLTGIPDKSYTSIQFGPDGRLYASHRFGEIYSFEVEPQIDPVTGKITSYAATNVKTISILKTIPNHNDDGTLASNVTNRQVTGITVTGTADKPVIYVVSSDPREGGGGGGGSGDLGLDTNSGILSRLTWNGSAWEKLDLVRGLPRSEENHSTNGLLLTTDPETGHRILLAAQGGNTNAGAPSKNFAYANETALSAAILQIDLTELESGVGEFAVKTDGAHKYVYDLPTVMGDTVGVFGGRDGLNQARLVEGGPVSIYSSGWRNPYDLVKTQSGDLFTIDNGANQGWGGLPSGEGTANVSNQLPTSDPDGFNSVNNLDHLEWISGPGYYGGHPNPVRANPGGAGIVYTDANGQEVWSQNPGGAWPPVDPAILFPQDGDFLLPGVEDGALVTWGVSTNGLAEYTSSAFQGAMQGNLITAAFDSSIYRIVLDPSNSSATKEALASGLPGIPLDVIAQGDNDIFPGTIWIAYVAGNADIEVLVPTFVTGTPNDFDGDGYSNADETANGTNPYSPSSVPPDNDLDFVSDLTDEDDDNDGLFDPVDHFALDAANGTGLVITDSQGFFNPLRNDDPGTGFAGLGFTGWMSNGTSDYLDLYDDDNLIAGGTSGIFTIVNTTPGDAKGAQNDQENGFQFGVTIATTGPVLVQANMLNVFSPLTAADLKAGQSAGIQIGSGDQDNYVKLAVGVGASGDLGILLLHEENGVVLQETFMPTAAVPIGADLDLYFEIDAGAGTVTPGWKVDGGAGQTGTAITVGGDILAALQSMYENGGQDSALAVGVISTSGPSGESFAAQYDFIDIFSGTFADEFQIA